ncbi:ABC transporter permease [Marisediminicola sp. LYQ134]|uniref:ABC transporter permease n=1 Tax=Marisediminicola sp. LYQ134 TaxID=3391061 RepID=UPI0039830102
MGIAIGIAAMVAVVGSSASSRALLDEQLASLGTNLLTATVAEANGVGEQPPLPADAAARVERIPGVVGSAATADLPLGVYRNALVDPNRSGGLTVTATDPDLLDVVGATVRAGRWFNAATATLPTTVLGSTAADRLGVREPGVEVWIDGQSSTVIGVLDPVPLAPELDLAALVGIPVALDEYAHPGNPTRLYERSADDAVLAVRDLMAPSLQPASPGSVAVSRPSDALAATNAVDQAFTGLLLALGSIALIVGGIGVANTMIISVLERRREIGLRRAIGATRRHIWVQFLTEAVLLSVLGGVAGAAIGSGVTAIIATANGWTPVVPLWVLVGGLAATTAIGAIAGLYPAVRAARTAPSVALSA